MVEQAARVCCGQSGGHPGLRMLEDLNLISSASSDDQLFGAFLYSNASVVAGLRAAARLAGERGLDELAGRWGAFADRIWEGGILPESVANRPASPGLVDPDSGRFLRARRVSKLRGLWTGDPDQLIDRAEILDINMLGLAVPFGLLPASDPRLVRIAETILRINSALKGDPNVLSRATFVPDESGRIGRSGDPHEVSSLATLWMVRFLIQLGRETGSGRHWTRALAMLEAILGRLSQLGLTLRSAGRTTESARRVSNPGGTAWRLHAMIIDTMLDLGGLDYDAVNRRLSLSPVLPGSWPNTGMKRSFPCGEVSYQLQRPIGGKVHHLQLRTRLEHPVTLQVALDLPRSEGAGSLAGERVHARADPRAPRPDHVEHVAPGGRERVELDVGMSAASPSWASGSQGRRLAQERVMAGSHIAIRWLGPDPESPQSSPEDNAFLQVMAEEGIAGRDEGRRDGWLLGRSATDPPRAIVGLDHLGIPGVVTEGGMCEDSRRQGVRSRRRDRKCRQVLEGAGRFPSVVGQGRRTGIPRLDPARARFGNPVAPLTQDPHFNLFHHLRRRRLDLNFQVETLSNRRRSPGCANPQTTPVGRGERRLEATPMQRDSDETCSAKGRLVAAADGCNRL